MITLALAIGVPCVAAVLYQFPRDNVPGWLLLPLAQIGGMTLFAAAAMMTGWRPY